MGEQQHLSAFLAPARRHFVTVTRDGRIKLWDVVRRLCSSCLPAPEVWGDRELMTCCCAPVCSCRFGRQTTSCSRS